MNDPQVTYSLLAKHFPELTERGLSEEISAKGKFERVKWGELFIDFGEMITDISLIYEGLVRVYGQNDDGNEIFLYHLEPETTCAASLTCCMQKRTSTVRAEAEEDITFIRIPASEIDPWSIKYPSWKQFMMNTYTMRFEALLTFLDELAFTKLDQRLLNYLNEIVKVNGNPVIQISHPRIASDLNSSREVISRLLKQLENLDFVMLGRGRIGVLATSDNN